MLPRQPAMLEPVVEKKNVRASSFPCAGPPRIDPRRSRREHRPRRIKICASSPVRSRSAHSAARNNHDFTRRFSPVPARQNRRIAAHFAQPCREMRDHRRLSCSAHRQPADADHRRLQCPRPDNMKFTALPRAPHPGKRRQRHARGQTFAADSGTPSPSAAQNLHPRCATTTPRFAIASSRAFDPIAPAARDRPADPQPRRPAPPRSDPLQCASRLKLGGDRGKIFHVRTHDHRLCEIGGLQNIVAAAIGERSAHEDHVGALEQRGQLADGIEQQNSRQSSPASLRPRRDEGNSGARSVFRRPCQTAPAFAAPESTATRAVDALNAAITTSSSSVSPLIGGMVLAAIHIASAARRSRNRCNFAARSPEPAE